MVVVAAGEQGSNRNQMVHGQKRLQFYSQGAGNVGVVEPLTCTFSSIYGNGRCIYLRAP